MSTSLHAVAPDPAAVINELLRPGIIRAHFQPIVRLADSAVVAYEALARMDHPLQWGPDRYLEMAASIGPRDELELACMRAASLAGAPPNGAMLFVNVSPGLLSNPAALAMRADFPVGLVLELTEQAIVDDYDELRKTARHWKAQGVRIAVDDLGSGWSTLRHVVQLRPDVIKIDQSLISGVDRFRSQRALVCSMVAFAREAGCTVVAEGVERPEELQVLREAEVPLVQGVLLARPGPPWPEAEL
ncbi:MAG: hypothetical protein JWL70_3071, partial [Acidimicrobiia bacterium]|nr:hypothetical protein [Acidimicrobiia bacterium]